MDEGIIQNGVIKPRNIVKLKKATTSAATTAATAAAATK
jgi:hypothetical protein